jgi:hypothetical protein
VADVDPKVMEPFEPIPGKPPRKVVIDRQRKLFASLDIEELLLEFVSKAPVSTWETPIVILMHELHLDLLVRESITAPLKTRQSHGFPLRPSTMPSMTADCLVSGSTTAARRMVSSSLFQERVSASSTNRLVPANGSTSLLRSTMKRRKSSLESGTTAPVSASALPELTFFSTQRTLAFSLRESTRPILSAFTPSPRSATTSSSTSCLSMA